MSLFHGLRANHESGPSIAQGGPSGSNGGVGRLVAVVVIAGRRDSRLAVDVKAGRRVSRL